MKKILFFILSVFIITFVGCEENQTYPKDGKDTKAYFGDGRFVVLIGNDINTGKYLDFYDRKGDNGSIDVIYNYKEKKPFVYTVGKKGYTKVNYETGELKQSNDMNEFEDKDKEVLKKLDEEKGKVKK